MNWCIARPAIIFSLIVAMVATSACSDPEILAQDYDQSCVVDGDCVLVFEGNVCACSRAGAVNIAERARFEADRARLQSECSGPDDSCLPPTGTPVCASGTCRIE